MSSNLFVVPGGWEGLNDEDEYEEDDEEEDDDEDADVAYPVVCESPEISVVLYEVLNDLALRNGGLIYSDSAGGTAVLMAGNFLSPSSSSVSLRGRFASFASSDVSHRS